MAAGTLFAAPAETGSRSSEEPSRSPSVSVGPAHVSLETTRGSIPLGAGFSYTAVVSSPEPLEYLQARMQLRHPTGRLIYQKTFIEQSLESGATSFVFERGLDDIGLAPGIYPLELSVRVSADGEISDEVVGGELRIYDPEREPLPVAMFARISAQPLTDPSGAFVSDPGQFTRARDDVAAISSFVISEPDSRLTLALSPQMLEEWQRIAGGYQLVGAEGVVEVDEGDGTPQAYADALADFRRAVETGRLEVMSLGYSDPDLHELANHRMIEDVSEQYAFGVSACFSAIGSSPSAGTAPAGGGLPSSAVSFLVDEGLEYVLVSDTSAEVNGSAATAGRYRAGESSLTALVADSEGAGALDGNDLPGFVTAAFARHIANKEGEPLPLLVTVGPGALTASALVDAVDAMADEPWADLRVGIDIASGQNLESVGLPDREADAAAPADYWSTVRESRRWSRALESALPTGTASVEDATRDSLIAQSSAWAGVAGEWAPAWRGLAFANNALRLSRGALSTVVLDVKPVTLAGTNGQVPVTITNDSEDVLELTLLQGPGRSLRIGSPKSRRIAVSPGENFVELPVELVNVLSSRLQVSLRAADVELAEETVEVRASFLDRLALAAGVILLLGGLLAFIILRVRSAEAASAGAEEDTRR